MNLKKFIRARLDAGDNSLEAQRAAEKAGRYAPWNYVRKIERDYEREKGERDVNAEVQRRDRV